MPKDHLERRAYRRSPGRQYGYDYDPLRSQSGLATSRPGALLVQRPDPRRTRQFLRQSIIASKRPISEENELVMYHEQERRIANTPPLPISRPRPKTTQKIRYTSQIAPYDEQDVENTQKRSNHRSHAHPKITRRIRYTSQMHPYDEQNAEVLSKRPGNRPPSRSGHLVESPVPPMHNAEDGQEEWSDFADEDPDLDPSEIEAPLYESDVDDHTERTPGQPLVRRNRRDLPSRALVHKRTRRLLEADDYDPDRIYEEDEELPPGLRVMRRRKISRRGLLAGAGVVVVGGGVVAATRLAPEAATQVSHSSRAVQEAFNRGVARGADSARKELVSALDSLEGFTLQGAIDAARLTRMAYDIFVSPVVHFGSELTSDFLKAMLNALKTARGWLGRIYQDNATLAAIQRALESWVDQVSKLPKQLDAITQTDLDGAQAYLTALQRKITNEKSKLNNPRSTPTTSAKPRSQATTQPTQRPTEQ